MIEIQIIEAQPPPIWHAISYNDLNNFKYYHIIKYIIYKYPSLVIEAHSNNK